MPEKKVEITPRTSQPVTRRDLGWTISPFRLLERFANDIDGMFDDFGLSRSWFGRRAAQSGLEMWSPAVEVTQQNTDLVVRADLPGLKK